MSTASRLDHLLPPGPGHTSLAPLFWQRGEGPERIDAEMRLMHRTGIDGVIVESRPHPDFLGPLWWRDIDAVMEAARELGMRVWIFDDKEFPTGGVGGAVRGQPAARKRFIRHVTIEAPGPVRGGRILVRPWLGEDERLLAACGLPCAPGDGRRLIGEQAVDLGTRVGADGCLRWDVPAGHWRVVLVIDTPTGGEDWTKDHLNPVEPVAVDLLIGTVYEPHRARYAADFGKTFAGFFSDEPRFGNCSGYDAIIGKHPMVLPWGPTLEAALRGKWGAGFNRILPALWHDTGIGAPPARFTYMDTVTDAWRGAWSRIGAWCTTQGVEWIGHVVEDSGAHTRLGYGAGHFFRAHTGMHAAGCDAVYQIWPSIRDGRCLSPFGDLDATFFFWGLARMTSSAAHLDPAKRGIAMCECFGAYGWQCGLAGMTWLTNHLIVRGINRLVPHAWSMRFPDADCPPHFHAEGHNPQSRHFHLWATYAARLCRAMSGGTHPSDAAVLYHAEAEWAGDRQPIEDVLRLLMVRQLDGEIMPLDVLAGERASVRRGQLAIAGSGEYPCLILPWAERLPRDALRRAAELAEAGLPVFVLRGLPLGASDGDVTEATALIARLARAATVIAEADLAQALIDRGLAPMTVTPAAEREWLRLYRQQRDGLELVLAVNEDPASALDATVRFPIGLPRPAAWDAFTDTRAALVTRQRQDGGFDVDLHLEAGQALLLVAPGEELERLLPLGGLPAAGTALCDLTTASWEASTATAEAWPNFTTAPAISGPGDVTVQIPGFAGTVRYRTTFDLAGAKDVVIDLGAVGEIATVRLNGTDLGTRLAAPYCFAAGAALRAGRNDLEIEVTTTLAPAHGENWLDRAWIQVPAGLLGPVTVNRTG